jgi:ectoine hydroxylase-related dioxygenase (phytanoyl-CoA dioxygenase family)
VSAQTLISDAELTAYRADGAVALRGAFADWVEPLRRGVERNRREPGPMATLYGPDDAPGRFFGDYCNWDRIPEYRDFVLRSPAAALAARVMDSTRVQIFHEHVLVKDAGTDEVTPWHHDMPYYCVDGDKVLSIWLALDGVPAGVCPRFCAGSHRWGTLYYPRFFKHGGDYAYDGTGYEPVPDIDAEADKHRILAWDLEPGDAVLFHFLTLHAAPGNTGDERRAGFATRWLGDDVRYARRPGTPSPPYPDIGLEPGDPMREDRFPVVWPRAGEPGKG